MRGLAWLPRPLEGRGAGAFLDTCLVSCDCLGCLLLLVSLTCTMACLFSMTSQWACGLILTFTLESSIYE